MTKITRPKAESRFAAVERRQRAILIEKDEAEEFSRKKIAKLKMLRLLRDAARPQA